MSKLQSSHYRNVTADPLREQIWETTALHYVTFVAESRNVACRPCLIKEAEE